MRATRSGEHKGRLSADTQLLPEHQSKAENLLRSESGQETFATENHIVRGWMIMAGLAGELAKQVEAIANASALGERCPDGLTASFYLGENR